MNWSVIVTTAPRKECTLIQTLESLSDCGWQPTVFAEPGSTVTDYETHWNEFRLGVWHNWLKACRFALNQNADFILTVQDDCEFHPESKQVIESIQWPTDAGYISLYTPKHYQRCKNGQLRPNGLFSVKTNSMWGACALAFQPSVLSQIVNHPRAASWIGVRCKNRSVWQSVKQKRIENPALVQNSDTIIGSIISKTLRRKMYYLNPSPCSHISRFSAIGHGDNKGRRNAWKIADPSIPLRFQIFGKHP